MTRVRRPLEPSSELARPSVQGFLLVALSSQPGPRQLQHPLLLCNSRWEARAARREDLGDSALIDGECCMSTFGVGPQRGQAFVSRFTKEGKMSRLAW